MKRKNLLSFLVLATMFFIGSSTWAQNAPSNNEGEWKLVHKTGDVSFYGSQMLCSIYKDTEPSTYVVLRIVNEGTAEQEVHYSFGLNFEEGCSGCEENSEYSYTLTIPANSSIEGDCTFKTDGLSRIISNPRVKGGWKFVDFNVESY